MALTNDMTIWTGETVGVTLEEYNGKYSIKVVRRWKQGGEDKIGWDWVYREGWNKDTKKKEMEAKPKPCGVYLGDKEQAKNAMKAMLLSLGEPDEIPF
jgi:hypothetical protein